MANQQRGNILEQKQFYDFAIKNYTDAIKCDSNNYYYYLCRGKLCRSGDEKGNKIKALSDFKKAYKLGYTQIRSSIEQLEDLIKREKVEELMKQIDLAAGKKNWEEVIIIGERLLEFSQKTQEIIEVVSNAYKERGKIVSKKDLQQAITDYNKAIELNPQFFEAYINRGVLYSRLKQFHKGIEDFNSAVALQPSNTLAYYNRATTLLSNKDRVAAKADFKKASDLGDDAALRRFEELEKEDQVQDLLIHFDKAFKQKDWDEAVELGQKLTSLDNTPKMLSKVSIAYFNRGNVYLERGGLHLEDGKHALAAEQFRKAIKEYNQAINMFPNYIVAYTHRGVAYRKLRDFDQAITSYTESIKLDDKFIMAYINRALAYKEKGDRAAARLDFEKAASLGSGQAKDELNHL